MPPLPVPPSQSLAPAGGYAGEVPRLFAYDGVCEVHSQATGTLLGESVGHCDLDPRNRHARRKRLFCRLLVVVELSVAIIFLIDLALVSIGLMIGRKGP